jgi:ABC-type thiamine transport system ATPase subunit
VSTLELSGVVDEQLGPLSIRFETGLHAVVSDSPLALGRCVELLAGVRPARQGRALLDGRDVFDTPSARRRLSSLLPVEPPLPAPSVRDATRLAAELRGASLDGASALRQSGLERFADLAPERLEAAERRAVALALALALDSTDAVVLHDPFALHGLVPTARVLARCRTLAERCCVVLTTTRLDDAIALGGSACVLERGQLFPVAGLALRTRPSSALTVRSPDARRLSTLLASHSAVQRVSFDERRSPRELSLHGAELLALARALCEVAAAQHIELESFAPLVPELGAPAP